MSPSHIYGEVVPAFRNRVDERGFAARLLVRPPDLKKEVEFACLASHRLNGEFSDNVGPGDRQWL